MKKQALALWPLAAKPRENEGDIALRVQHPEEWNQEAEKLRNERGNHESAQEKIQALVPGLDFKRIGL